MFEIQVYYTRFNNQLSNILYDYYLNLLPLSLQLKNAKYRRWQDRHSHLFGKLLLIEGLKNYGYTAEVLNNLKYNEYNRPFIDPQIDFNISHSGEFVICAIGKDVRLGVDIEQIAKINFDDFCNVMTPEQWNDILFSEDSLRSFFNYWTIKESVLKGDGRGISIPLTDIHIVENRVRYDNQIWHLKNLYFDENYCATLARNNIDVDIKMNYLEFEKVIFEDFRLFAELENAIPFD